MICINLMTSVEATRIEPPEPRGLLCGPCNHALGLFKDDPEICLAAKDYLEVWS